MLLFDSKFDDKHHLEIVDGHDIVKTYRDSWAVSSCLSGSSRVKFFTEVVGCKVLRLLKCNLFRCRVVARGLIWVAKDEAGKSHTLLDTLYTSRDISLKYDIYELMKEHGLTILAWKKPVTYIDIPDSYIVKEDVRFGRIPYLDNFTSYIVGEHKLWTCVPHDADFLDSERYGYAQWQGSLYKRRKMVPMPTFSFTTGGNGSTASYAYTVWSNTYKY